MSRTNLKMRVFFVAMFSVLLLTPMAFADDGESVRVNCNYGQSLNGTLAKLNKQGPNTVVVQGTCTEFVRIDGFEDLTLKGQSGAVIQQPASNPQNISAVLSITGSRGISIFSLTVNSLPLSSSGIGISKGSSQVQLKNVNVTGTNAVEIYEESQVWLIGLKATISSGFAVVSVWDKSDVHIAGGLLQPGSDSNYYTGLLVGSGHVTLQGMTIRDMHNSIDIYGSGSVDLINVDPTQPSDVNIENPSGTNTNGVLVTDGSSLNLGFGRLFIKNAGQPYGGTSGAVFVTNNSSLNAGANLIVSNSQGQGVVVTNNSHATLGGSSITGGLHGGLVAANLSTIDLQSFTSLTSVSGNQPDLFCDSNSYITGTANLTAAPSASCANQLPNNTVPLP